MNDTIYIKKPNKYLGYDALLNLKIKEFRERADYYSYMGNEEAAFNCLRKADKKEAWQPFK